MEQTPQSTPQSNPFATMHKQRLYSLIIAAIGLITMFFSWISLPFFGSVSGFRSWGWLSFFGIAAVVAATFMGNKEQPYDSMFKNVVTAGFGAMTLGALIFFIKISGAGVTGFGVWACMIVGLVGLGFILGFIKIPQDK